MPTSNFPYWLAAGVVFWAIGYVQLWRATGWTRVGTIGALHAITAVGLLASMIHGFAHDAYGVAVGEPSAKVLGGFGSLGLYTGFFLAAYGLAPRDCRVLVPAAIVAPLVASAAVARTGCYFVGCCSGHPPAALAASVPFGGFVLGTAWPLVDLGVLVLLCTPILRMPPTVVSARLLGRTAGLYLTARFVLEFARPSQAGYWINDAQVFLLLAAAIVALLRFAGWPPMADADLLPEEEAGESA